MDSKKKQHFWIISFLYSLALSISFPLFNLLSVLTEYRLMGLIHGLIMFLLTCGYFKILQLMVKRIINSIYTLAAMCLVGFLVLSVLVLSTLEVTSGSFLIDTGSLIAYLVITLWTSYSLWMKGG